MSRTNTPRSQTPRLGAPFQDDIETPTWDIITDLVSRKAFPEAIEYAQAHNCEQADVADIYKKYGDYLYGKADFDNAMQQYIQTVGHVQASYVIRKYLDTQRTSALTEYLQEVHNRRLASSDLTTLLLNCYAKLNDVDRLNEFIQAANSKVSSGSLDELPFDLETAINVCRQAGFHDHAVYLAQQYKQHDQYLAIQIEDRKDWTGAISYIRTLSVDEAKENLLLYGKLLLKHASDETTKLLIDLCCGNMLLPEDSQGSNPTETVSTTSYLSYLPYHSKLSLPTNSRKQTLAPSSESEQQQPSTTTTVTSTLKNITSFNTERQNSRNGSTRSLTSKQQEQLNNATVAIPPVNAENATTGSSNAIVQQNEDQPAVIYPSPKIFFPLFIDSRFLFILFLETIAARRWSQDINFKTTTSSTVSKNKSEKLNGSASISSGKSHDEIASGQDEEKEKLDQRSVWNSLLEMYLQKSEEEQISFSDPAAKKPADDQQVKKAIKVLENENLYPYDPFQALVVCTNASFTPGILLLYEKLGMIEEILRFWMNKSFSAVTKDDIENGNDAKIERKEEKDSSTYSQKVVESLRRFGPTHPHLYPMVMRYLASSPELLNKHTADLQEILARIENDKIMQPIAVLQALSQTEAATVGLVRDYLKRQINAEREQIKADRSLVESYRKEAAKMQKEMDELTDINNPRVYQVTRCSACSMQLDLPKVYFQCQHFFHQRCLGDNDLECPICAKEHDMIREVMQANEKFADRHDLFIAEIEESDDKFGTIAHAFSKGLILSSSSRSIEDVNV